NGTGKTTALLLMLGLQKPQRGKVTLHDPRIAAVPQNPQTLFDGKTVEEDLREVLADRHLAKQETQAKLCEIARLCLLEELLQAHPYDLSGGEQQRAALAKVLLLEPKILLLDEPTKGLDAEFKQVFAGILRQLAAAGTAVVMVSHDIEFCAETCARCALFFDGAIVTQGGTRAFFAGNSFYTTAANRMARHVLPAAITVGDVIAALDGTQPLPPAPPPPRQSAPFVASAKKNSPPRPRRPAMPRKLPKRTVAAAVIILLLIPLTLFVGTTLFGGRKYYFTALFIILESMLPFALLFEKRRPQARELVILAVLTALAVAGRTAFFMLPQFKPVAALVIIAGVAFGGEAGFLVGALTGFVSNMLFGQGPWTPWQMFAFGVIGFLAGVLFKKGLLPQNRAALCVFGGLATFVVYGGLLNAQSALLFLPEPTSAAVFAIYLQGLPFDLAHALSTVIFLAVAAPLMLKKLDRVKVKYGLAEPCGR
ncbi:MAG: ATP-binding cassette domain-containing protein, partial [Oscillospiraceae bacterium]|nr:ATP-binding cassette domain-containing protein [Oscillospiraceae bacterium]